MRTNYQPQSEAQQLSVATGFFTALEALRDTVTTATIADMSRAEFGKLTGLSDRMTVETAAGVLSQLEGDQLGVHLFFVAMTGIHRREGRPNTREENRLLLGELESNTHWNFKTDLSEPTRELLQSETGHRYTEEWRQPVSVM